MPDDDSRETPSEPDRRPAPKKPPSRVEYRLIQGRIAVEADDPYSIVYQHTVFCQTGLPYRNPGATAREWERRNGNVGLKIVAGEAYHPETGEWVKLGLPFGVKPRLILTYLNREALIRGTPVIEVGDSLTAFARSLLGFDPNGKEIRLLKDQLGRLAGAMVRLGVARGDRGFQLDTKVVTSFDLWFPKDERQRVLWPSVVKLDLDYFESLQRHAVPLDERAVAALAHSAMALDVYAWLAQRLHRVPARTPQVIPWARLREQFGWHYGRMVDFRRVFRHTLGTVLSQYPGARVELDDLGLTLRNSPPPVQGRLTPGTS